MLTQEIRKIIQGALAEDIGSGDVTSLPTIPSTTSISGEFLVKAEGVIAGLEIVGEVFRQVDSGIVYEQLVEDGAHVSYGDVVAKVSGVGPWILVAERVALNFLQRMSGIATLTQQYVQAVEGTRARILDTRKTVPRPASTGQAGRGIGWRHQSPYRPVRYGADQGQPHRGRWAASRMLSRVSASRLMGSRSRSRSRIWSSSTAPMLSASTASCWTT